VVERRKSGGGGGVEEREESVGVEGVVLAKFEVVEGGKLADEAERCVGNDVASKVEVFEEGKMGREGR
jgi:hypothetical protein